MAGPVADPSPASSPPEYRRVGLVLLLLTVLVNLPLVHGAVSGWRFDRVAVEERAAVVELEPTEGDIGGGVVTFRLGEGLDPDGTDRTAPLTPEGYARVEAQDVVEVRVDPDDPGRFEVEGAPGSSALTLLTLIADAFLLAAFVLMLLARRRPDENDENGEDDGAGPATIGP